MTQNNTVETSNSAVNRTEWPVEDCIRWVEWRVRELTIREGKYVDDRGKWLLEEKRGGGRRLVPGDMVADYAVWLLHVRDDASWHQLAHQFFPFATEAHIEAYESKLRRTFRKVERMHPGRKSFRPSPLSKEEKLLLDAVKLGAIPIYLRSNNE